MRRILILRLSSMGDIIHTLPAAATLKHSWPGAQLTWAVHRRWLQLLEGNPFIDRLIPIDRSSVRGIFEAMRALGRERYDIAVDFQGLIQSALAGTVARPEHLFGYHQSQVRERLAALFYSDRVLVSATHIVDRHLELARAAGASTILRQFPLPEGQPEGRLPTGPFVLASPLAGWMGKQWPLERYAALAARVRAELGMELVINGAPGSEDALGSIAGARVHISGIPGLIYATRRAAAVVGIDSGPLHLAAALCKPGVAIFGPTDPARNGPYGSTFTVLRDPSAVTTYRRRSEYDASILRIDSDAVFEALKARVTSRRLA
ncbi:MAG: glycosyltransferase family 9 protein [bacterium]